MDGYACCGSPRSRSRVRMRASPNSSGHGESDSTQLIGESVELTAIAVRLVALGRDDVRRRVLDEPLVGEHPFRARDLLLQAIDLGGRVAVAAAALRLHHGVEDSSLFAVERGANAAAAEDRRSVLDGLQRIALSRERCLRLEPRRDDKTRFAIWQVRPDLLRHVWHHWMQELKQALERGQRG